MDLSAGIRRLRERATNPWGTNRAAAGRSTSIFCNRAVAVAALSSIQSTGNSLAHASFSDESHTTQVVDA